MIHLRQNPPNGFGYVLIPVMLLLSVIAAVAYLMNVEGAINANAASRELDSTNAQFVAEAGYTEAKWHLAQNTTCTGYTGLPATAFGDSSYSVSVSPTDGSPVLLSAKGSMASGAAKVLTRSVSSYQDPVLLSLRPESTAQDTYLRDGANQNNNFGASTILRVNNASAEEVSLLRFDVSFLPQGSHVISASLSLDLDGGISLVNGRLDLHRITREWFEGNEDGAIPTTSGATYQQYDGSDLFADWATPGGDYEATPVDSVTIATLTTGRYEWDLSALVESWVSGVQANHGVLLRAGAGFVQKIEFKSSNVSGNGGRPRLDITYACECGKVCSGGVAANLLVSPAFTTSIPGINNFKAGAIAEYDAAEDDATSVFNNNKIDPANLNALHRLSNGDFVLTAATNATVSGLNFAPGDLALYDPDTDSTSLYFNGMLFDTPTDIEAIHLRDDGNLLLSTATDTTLGGLNFTPDDVVEYNPTTDTATLFFDGSLFGLAFPATSIDALHLLANGHLLLSTDSNAELGGLTFTAAELVDYDPVANDASIYTPLFEPGADLDAVSLADDAAPLPPIPPKPALCAGTVLDSFHRRSYAESDGNINWTADWLETDGETDGALSGNLQVASDLGGYRLRVKNTGMTIERGADLSAYSTATLSFQYRRVGLDDNSDKVKVEIKRNSGPNWDNLLNLSGPATDASYQSFSVNIDGYMSATSRIRIRSSNSLGDTDFIYLDNFMICAEN